MFLEDDMDLKWVDVSSEVANMDIAVTVLTTFASWGNT